MQRLIFVFMAASVFSLDALADKPPPPPVDAAASSKNDAPHEEEAGRLVRYARDLRAKNGCAAAAPAYRVVAGMGEGEEAAQHELGACLLEIEGASSTETALFRQEGEFWLTRAAFAGNARAQRMLAMEMASPASALHDVKSALQWALVYADNPTAKLYGFGPLPATLIPGLKSAMNDSDAVEAEKFAKEFAPIALAKFEGPKREKGKGERIDSRNAPIKGERRRPGLAD